MWVACFFCCLLFVWFVVVVSCLFLLFFVVFVCVVFVFLLFVWWFAGIAVCLLFSCCLFVSSLFCFVLLSGCLAASWRFVYFFSWFCLFCFRLFACLVFSCFVCCFALLASFLAASWRLLAAFRRSIFCSWAAPGHSWGAWEGGILCRRVPVRACTRVRIHHVYAQGHVHVHARVNVHARAVCMCMCTLHVQVHACPCICSWRVHAHVCIPRGCSYTHVTLHKPFWQWKSNSFLKSTFSKTTLARNRVCMCVWACACVCVCPCACVWTPLGAILDEKWTKKIKNGPRDMSLSNQLRHSLPPHHPFY